MNVKTLVIKKEIDVFSFIKRLDQIYSKMLFVFFFAFILSTVDRNNFRSCKDMRFCRENQKKSNKWSLDPKSAQIKDDIFTANLLLDSSPNNISLSIYALKSGGIRFRMTPTQEESFQRYDLSKNAYVIDQDAMHSISPIKDSSSTDSEFVINFGDYQGISLTIEYSSLKISVKQNNKIVTIINGRSQLVFEHHTNKQVPPEVFNGFTDYIKNGETAVGADFFFPGDVKLTGLSERASPVNLADTEPEEDAEQNSEADDESDSNEPLRLFNTDSFEFEADSPVNLYSSIPFCHAHSIELSAALFWINPSDTFINIKTYSKDDHQGREIKFVSESGYVDFILFYGQNQDSANNGFKQIMKQYCELTGYPMFAPLFALGYHQSRWTYATQHEVGVVMRGLDDIGIPFDCIWLDVDHLASKAPFTFSRQGFPNPSNIISELANNDRYLVRLCDPHFPHSNDYKQYKESHRSNFLVTESGNAPFIADCWPGPCVWPDFLNPSAFRWYSQQFTYENEKDGSGPNVFYWNDMNEPSIFKSDQSTFPKGLIHYGGHEDREVHNIFGLLNTASTFQGLLNRNPDSNMRPFILTRSYFAGSQKFAWTWTGDNTASWEHLAVSLSMVLTSGCCGMPFTGADLGGFLKSPDGNLLIRWFQLGVWLYPFYREHCHHRSARREPFMYDGEEQDILKEAVITRYKILPLWYSAIRRTHLTGVPPVLPLWAVFKSDSEVDYNDIDSVAILDESLYVAPVLEDDVDELDVIKPPGVWYRFETGKKLEGPSETIPVTIKDTPVFIRGGKIIPTFSEVGKSALSTISSCPLTLYVALDENGNADGELYFDDGESYNYMKGEFVHRKFVCINGQLKSIKGDEKQASIPELVKNSIINKVIIYGSSGPVESSDGNASYENGILTIENLNLNINNDWSLKIQ